MKSELAITNETVTQYFNKISSDWFYREPKLLEDLGELYTAEVDPAVDTATLVESGLDKNNWKIVSSKEIVNLQIVYSGMANKKRWTEFGGDNSRSEWRDYAYFQETGIDEVASPSHARRKHFIRNAAEFSGRKIIETTEKEFFRILQNG